MDTPRVFVPTCMRNEGAFVLEWLAYHRHIGISDILVYVNDCEDGTDLLLQRLQELGLVRVLPNPGSRDQGMMQGAAFTHMIRNRLFGNADYILSMDVDEFVLIAAGKGRLADLFEATGPFDVLSMMEANFGNAGRKTFEPGFVTEQFRRRQTLSPDQGRAERGVKSLVRPRRDLQFRNHRPMRTRTGAPLVWLDGSGAAMPASFTGSLDNSIDCRGRYRLARINHYPLKSWDDYLVKRERGQVTNTEKLVGKRYWRRRDGDDEDDIAILRHADAIREGVERLLADAEIARLHGAAVDWRKRRAEALRDRPDNVALARELFCE